MKTITLNHICKIEGHATLDIKIDKNQVKDINLKVVEGARFFENIVKGRSYKEAPALMSRICGICSASHCISSIHAIEKAFGYEASEQTKLMRELLEYGEVMQSHIMHLYFMALPDYLGYENALDMAKKYKNELVMALQLKKLSQDFIHTISGREVHPISAVAGGFSKAPKKEEIRDLLRRFRLARKQFTATMKLFESLDYPKFERNREFFAVHGSGKYPFHGNTFCSSNDAPVKAEDYTKVFNEGVKRGSSAKIALSNGRSFFVGALARNIINYSDMTKTAQKHAVKKLNPYYNNIAQAVELVHLCDRTIDILEQFEPKKESFEIKPKAGRGIGLTEAPRGLLVHDYTLDKDGKVKTANVITPTVFNLQSIEDDIKLILPRWLKAKMSEDKIVLEIEKLIRAYDPCISCSSHFLRVNWK